MINYWRAQILRGISTQRLLLLLLLLRFLRHNKNRGEAVKDKRKNYQKAEKMWESLANFVRYFVHLHNAPLKQLLQLEQFRYIFNWHGR
ncbi:MAG: hypothetical protein WKF30_01590 [Pyrinomonadaceae bacterium]